ncbi:MAG: PilW family protein [Thermodesulfovibrionales bacterium]
MKTNLMIKQVSKGFTLIELMVVIGIFGIVLAAAFSAYVYFVNSTTRESELTMINSDVATVLKLLERDIQMAGFGLPVETRVASHNDCNAGNENFCKSGTDRLFVADGWEILRDFTDDQKDDGLIPTSPTDYYSRIANSKNDSGGYRSPLSSPATSGTSQITVDTINIDSSDERSDPDQNGKDIKDNKSLIISDGQNVEGHRIATMSGNTINLLSNDYLIKNYPQDSRVVPAIAWYVRKDSTGKKYPDGSDVYWLYRNENKVMPYVEDFQIRYGYGAFPNDPLKGGIQENDWSDKVPPDHNPDSVGLFDFRYLKALEITLKIKYVDKKHPDKVIITDFKKIVDLKN